MLTEDAFGVLKDPCLSKDILIRSYGYPLRILCGVTGSGDCSESSALPESGKYGNIFDHVGRRSMSKICQLRGQDSLKLEMARSA